MNTRIKLTSECKLKESKQTNEKSMKNKTNAAKLYTRLFSNTNFPCLYLTVAHTYIHRHIQTSPTPHRPTRVARAFNTFHISRLIANTQQFSLWFVRLPRIFPTLFMHIAHIYPIFFCQILLQFLNLLP